MLEFTLRVIKVLLPCIVAGAVVRYINVQNKKVLEQIEHAQGQNENEEDEVSYEIAYPPVIYGIMYVCLCFYSFLYMLILIIS